MIASPGTRRTPRDPGPFVGSLDALRLESDRRLVRTTLVVMLVTTGLNIVTDAMIVGTGAEFTPFLWLRGAFVLGLLLWVWRLRRVTTRRAFEWEVLAMACAATLSVCIIQWMRPPGNMAIVRFAMLLCTGFYVVLPNRLWWQAGPAIALSAAVSATLAIRPAPSAPADLVLVPMMFALSNVMGIVVSRRRDTLYASEERAWQAERDARQALEVTLSELQVLRGVLPICSHCRKVRTDVGDWQQLELYVREHSEADFSHGVCPDCTAKHYPQVAAELQKEERRRA